MRLLKVLFVAALSGHLALSTIHAQDIYGVIKRLLNLGVTQVDMSQTVKMVNYQRLLPIINGQMQILFDQLDLSQVELTKILNKNGMTFE